MWAEFIIELKILCRFQFGCIFLRLKFEWEKNQKHTQQFYTHIQFLAKISIIISFSSSTEMSRKPLRSCISIRNECWMLDAFRCNSCNATFHCIKCRFLRWCVFVWCHNEAVQMCYVCWVLIQQQLTEDFQYWPCKLHLRGCFWRPSNSAAIVVYITVNKKKFFFW